LARTVLTLETERIKGSNPWCLWWWWWWFFCKVQVKQSHYKPVQALRVPGGWDSQISKQSAHEGGKVVSPKHRPPLPQEIFLVLISVRGW